MMKKVWVWEQMVLAALLALALRTQLLDLVHAHTLTWRTGGLVVIAAVLTFVTQKTRSIADRQKEEDALAGIVSVKVECHKAQARWGGVAQVLGFFLSLMLAPTFWHVLIGLYVGLYADAWRRFYRAHLRG